MNRRRLSVVGALAVTVAAGGCGGVQTLSFRPPPPTVPVPVVTQPTLPSGLSSVIDAAVPGATTIAAPIIGPGSAALNGTVLGPSGPVAGAIVEADRLVGDQEATVKTKTAADGSWSIPSILGGRYRVRAWQSPGLTLLTPQIFFLPDTQVQSMTLQLTSFTGPDVAASIAPGVVVQGQRENLLVQVTNPTVGADGVVRDLPDVDASVTLTDGPEWNVYNGNPLKTGAGGQVLFQVSCEGVGSVPLSAEVGSTPPITLQLPSCGPSPTTTTTTTFPSVVTVPCPSTTTPAGQPASPTATTTLPPGSC